MICRASITALIAASVGAACSVPAAEYPLPKGFPNYYVNEPQGPNWVVDAKIILQSPNVGTPLPTSATLGIAFAWNSVDGQLNREQVFRTYTRGSTSQKGTQFDLVTAPDSTGVYTYAQSSTVRPTLSSSPQTVATVQFQPIPITAPANGTVTTLFEIYGDCLECDRNHEARPPDNFHTTWRIFGKLRVTADAHGNLLTATIVDQDSESPPKKLDDTWQTIYPPEWFPVRKLERRESFGTASTAPFGGCNGSCQPSCSRCPPVRRHPMRCHRFW